MKECLCERWTAALDWVFAVYLLIPCSDDRGGSQVVISVEMTDPNEFEVMEDCSQFRLRENSLQLAKGAFAAV